MFSRWISSQRNQVEGKRGREIVTRVSRRSNFRMIVTRRMSSCCVCGRAKSHFMSRSRTRLLSLPPRDCSLVPNDVKNHFTPCSLSLSPLLLFSPPLISFSLSHSITIPSSISDYFPIYLPLAWQPAMMHAFLNGMHFAESLVNLLRIAQGGGMPVKVSARLGLESTAD